MKADPSNDLENLRGIAHRYEPGLSAQKSRLIARLSKGRFSSAEQLVSFHETLCFLRAYPDDERVREAADDSLAGFADRRDLRRFRFELQNSGIAGTIIRYPFYWETAHWLASHWPGHLTIDWWAFENTGRLESFLHLLVPYSESPYLDETSMSLRNWIEALKGPDETDAAFVVKRIDALDLDTFAREAYWDSLDLQIAIKPGPTTPNRGTETAPAARKMIFQTKPLDRRRPNLRKAIQGGGIRVRSFDRQQASKYLDLTRGAMVTRMRDLDSFANADIDDARIIDCGGGLELVCFGARPERRLLLECVYGFLTLKNGVPIGYVLASSLFESTEVAYNVFDSFRGGEAGHVFGRVIAMIHHLFGSTAFSIDTYQLGFGNPEGLASGAWWFYYKMGFRPRDREVRRILRGELDAMKKDPRHRSSIETLESLASEKMFFSLDRAKKDILGSMSPGAVGHEVSKLLSARFGSEREKGLRSCAREAARILGVRSTHSFSKGEKLAWERWSPIVLLLETSGWSPAEKRSCVRVIRAKGGRRESDFVRLFDRHEKLRAAVGNLMRA